MCLTYIWVVVLAIKPTCNFYQLLIQFKLVYQRMLQNESLAVWHFSTDFYAMPISKFLYMEISIDFTQQIPYGMS